MEEQKELTDFLFMAHYQVMQDRLDKYREQNTRATKNYREKNREKVNAIAKKYYDTHKEDPEWLAHKRERQRLYQRKRRELKTQQE